MPENFPPNVFHLLLEGNLTDFTNLGTKKHMLFRDLGLARPDSIEYLANITKETKARVRTILVRRAQINLDYMNTIMKKITKLIATDYDTPKPKRQKPNPKPQKQIQDIHKQINKLLDDLSQN
jgi:hypothetical protein